MKSLVFDTSSVISLITNNLLDITVQLKKKFNGEFIIPTSVKEELIDNPLHGKKYEFQALLFADALAEGKFKLMKNLNVNKKAEKLMNAANNIFYINNKPLKIVDLAEVEGLVLACELKASAYVVDERTLRLLVEDYRNLTRIFERKFKEKVGVNQEQLKLFNDFCGEIKIIRSVELITVAYELGLFQNFLQAKELVKEDFERRLLDGLLWGLKLRGCSVSSNEIEDILKLEKFSR